MSVWRNEEDFMRNMDNNLSEFYIKDKKITHKKLTVQTPKQNKSWYDSESDDECTSKDQNVDDALKCPSMELMNTLQMMNSIRMQVRNTVGDRYNNDVLESYYKVNLNSNDELSDPSKNLETKNVETSVPSIQVNKSSKTNTKVNGHKADTEEPVASSSKLNSSNNVKSRSNFRGKTSFSNGRAGGRVPTRYHNNVAFNSLQSGHSYNFNSKSEFPPL